MAKIKTNPFSHQQLEEQVMRLLLQSKNIGSFTINMEQVEYGLIPYNKRLEIYPENYFRETYPDAYNYLLLQKEKIEQQSTRSKVMANGENNSIREVEMEQLSHFSEEIERKPRSANIQQY